LTASALTADHAPAAPGRRALCARAFGYGSLVRLVLDGERVVAEERLLDALELRVREVRQGPDGALYVFGGDSLLRLTPP
jgi:glucose/arabinose dehydrogenase